MAIIVEEFDSVKITNPSIQFFENGVQTDGVNFGGIGTLEGETELSEFIKKYEGVEVKKKTRPIKMTNTVSAHIPVTVARDFFGISNKNLQAGVYAYGTDSKGKDFTLTAEIIDEFNDDSVKLIAFPNCTSSTGFKLAIENGGDEVAELELEFTAMKDGNNKFYYEAYLDEIPEEDRGFFREEWHRSFKSSTLKGSGI